MPEITIQIIAFMLPVVLVVLMTLFNRYFAGHKTNVQAVLGILAGVGSSQLDFISPEVLASLVTGIGVATGIASLLTKRAPKPSVGEGFDDGGGAV